MLGRKKILAVDDDPRNRRLFAALIREEGHDCLCMDGGSAALDAVGHYRPDLLLVDLMMPGMDGFELTRRLKARDDTRTIPVILVTALGDRDTRIKGLEVGAEEFITKPVDRLELGIRCRNLLRLKEYSDALTRQNDVLELKVRARTRELWETRLQVVRSLGRAAEFRDNETGMHIIRISKSSQLIARAIGLGEEQAELILHASPMHDIGKVGIPDHILLKPGKLTAEEREIIKTHTTIGHEILSSAVRSDLVDMARRIALFHHEWWDGSGYPHGLEGEAIPIEARIVAVADVFDALTSERPYKDAWSVEDSFAEMERQKGKHFEPRLVDALRDLLPEITRARKTYQDKAPICGTPLRAIAA